MKPLVLITEAYDRSEDRLGKPLTGTYGYLFDWLLIQSNLMRKHLTIKSIFPMEVKRSKDGKQIMDTRGTSLWSYSGGYQDEGRKWEDRIKDFLNTQNGDAIIVPMGELCLGTVCDVKGIRKYRGSPLEGNYGLAIPTLQPWQVSERGEYLLRYAVASDLRKAKRWAEGFEARPKEFIIPATG